MTFIIVYEVIGKRGNSVRFHFLGLQNKYRWCSHKIKMLLPWKNSYDKPRQCIEKWRHHFVSKGPYSQNYDFSSSDVWMWVLDHKEGWMPKNWCFWTLEMKKTLESPLDSKEIKLVNPKGNQPWIFTGRMKLKLQYFGHLMWLIGKDPDSGKDWEGKRRRGWRGWDGWMVSMTQWIWVWANSGRQWKTGKSGMLQFMGSQRVGHDNKVK